jgi:hypothetical protein
MPGHCQQDAQALDVAHQLKVVQQQQLCRIAAAAAAAGQGDHARQQQSLSYDSAVGAGA